jgi:hypothetical protein
MVGAVTDVAQEGGESRARKIMPRGHDMAEDQAMQNIDEKQ